MLHRDPADVLADIDATKATLYPLDCAGSPDAYWVRARLYELRREYGRALDRYCMGHVAIDLSGI